MNVLKNGFSVLFVVSVLLCSCSENQKTGTNSEDIKEESMRQAIALLILPDSLRSEENKALTMQLESVIFESCTLKNGRIDMTVDKKEWKKKGIPEIYFDILKQEINDVNHWLDTVSYPFPHLFEESWRRSCDEYLARKEFQKTIRVFPNCY